MFQGFSKKDMDFTDNDKDIDIDGSEENDTDEEYCWIGKTRGAKKTETAGNSDKLTKMLEKTCNIGDNTSSKLSEKSQTPQTKTVESQENSLLKEEDISTLSPVDKAILAILQKKEAEKPHIPVSMPPHSMTSDSSAPLSPPEVINTQIFEANKDSRVTLTGVMNTQDKALDSLPGFTGLNHPIQVKKVRYLFESDHNRDPKPCQGQVPDSVFDSRRSCNPFPAKDVLFGPNPKLSLDPPFKFPNFDTPEKRDDLKLLKEQSALISSEVTPPNSGSDSKQDQNPSQVKTDPKRDSNPSQSNLHLSTPGGSEDETLTKSSEVDNLTKSSHDEHINDDDNKSFLISLLPLISSFSEIQKLQFRAGIYNLILRIKTFPVLSPHQFKQIFENNIIPPAYYVGQNSAHANQTQPKPSHDEHIDSDNRSFLMLLLPLISSFNEIQKLQFRADIYNLIIKIKTLFAPSPNQLNQLSTNILPPDSSIRFSPAYQTQSNVSATSNLMHGTYPTPHAPSRYWVGY